MKAAHWIDVKRPTFQAIVGKAREIEMTGTSVLRGTIGYGANSRIHTASIVDLSGDLPVLIEVVDSEEYINQLLPFLDEVLDTGGMVTMDDIEVIKYGKKPPKR